MRVNVGGAGKNLTKIKYTKKNKNIYYDTELLIVSFKKATSRIYVIVRLRTIITASDPFCVLSVSRDVIIIIVIMIIFYYFSN